MRVQKVVTEVTSKLKKQEQQASTDFESSTTESKHLSEH